MLQSVSEKLDEDPHIKKKQIKSKQHYARYMHFYGLSVEGGKDRAKVIIANKEEASGVTSKAKELKDSQAKTCKKGKQKVVCFYMC